MIPDEALPLPTSTLAGHPAVLLLSVKLLESDRNPGLPNGSESLSCHEEPGRI